MGRSLFPTRVKIQSESYRKYIMYIETSVNFLIGLEDINMNSYRKLIKEIRSQDWVEGPERPINVQPCWFSGSPAEVMRHYADFKEILRADDRRVSEKIHDIKQRNSISETGNSLKL